MITDFKTLKPVSVSYNSKILDNEELQIKDLVPGAVPTYDPKLTFGSESFFAKQVSHKEFYNGISYQMQTNTCTGNATADTLENVCNQKKLAGAGVDLSRMKLYFDGRSIQCLQEGVDWFSDSGTTIYGVMKAAHVFGVCPESLWKFAEANVNVRPTMEAYYYGLGHKLPGFHRVTSTGNVLLKDIKSVLDTLRTPFVCGIPVTDAFRAGNSKVIECPRDSDIIRGFHAISICGYDEDDNIEGLNSWGTGYGDRGFFKLHKDWFVRGLAFDIVVPESGIALS